MIGYKVAERAIVMDRLQRMDREGEREKVSNRDLCVIKSLPKVKTAKSDDSTKTNHDIVLNLSLFFVLKALWRSVRDFPHCPSWEARPQQEVLLYPTLNSQNC